MTTLNSTEARSNFYGLIAQVNDSHEQITITGKKGNAVLISEDDWNAINETLNLLNIKGMRESIISGMKEPVENCETELNW
ncbi:MAG: type II toxin-antitoxin system Phd/YefM family antitoxin [Thiotrichales bacterium]|jgi:prevent-host-death family protein|nr:type II toxin-antitoxin system Phd/YefM family antitoxin [Thiotrichales bacterium]